MALPSDYHMCTPLFLDFWLLEHLNLSTIQRLFAEKLHFPQAKRELDEILAAHPQLR